MSAYYYGKDLLSFSALQKTEFLPRKSEEAVPNPEAAAAARWPKCNGCLSIAGFVATLWLAKADVRLPCCEDVVLVVELGRGASMLSMVNKEDDSPELLPTPTPTPLDADDVSDDDLAGETLLLLVIRLLRSAG